MILGLHELGILDFCFVVVASCALAAESPVSLALVRVLMHSLAGGDDAVVPSSPDDDGGGDLYGTLLLGVGPFLGPGVPFSPLRSIPNRLP